jgi:protein SCO1/2
MTIRHATIALISAALGAAYAAAHGPHGGPHSHSAADAPLSAIAREQLGGEVPVPGSYGLPAVMRAGDGRVLDHTGRDQRLASYTSGRITLLSFIYTNCADPSGCPLAMGTLFEIYHASEKAPVLGRNARLVTVSFDPERDTPGALASYAHAAIADPDSARKVPWSFLTTRSQRELKPILEQYGQPVAPRGTGDQLNHLLRLYLIDRKGRIRNIYGLGMLDPRFLLADIESLLIEDGTLAARTQ